MGVPDRAGQTAADHPVRVPAGAQRRVSEAIFRGIPWILAHGRIRRVQSGAGDYAVWLLGACAQEVRGGDADCDGEPSGAADARADRAGLLRPAVRGGEEDRRTPGCRETEAAPCGGETHAQGLLVLAGGDGAAAAGGRIEEGGAVRAQAAAVVGELLAGREVPDLQQSGGERDPSVHGRTEELAVQRYREGSQGKRGRVQPGGDSRSKRSVCEGLSAYCVVESPIDGFPPRPGAAQAADAVERLHARLL